MTGSLSKQAIRLASVVGVALLASCATPPAPPPPPRVAAPAPAPVQIPYRPQPPNGASLLTPIPPLGVDGVRMTVNAHLSPAATTWNLRSALNVAALNCMEPQFAAILPAYRDFLTRNEKKLASTNRALDEEFRKRHGSRDYRNQRDVYMTQVYNYFALPPARESFCNAVVQQSNQYMAAPPQDLDAYAAVALPQLETTFEDFYRRFEAYRIAVADWDSRYGAQYGATQPGYVAVSSFGSVAGPGAIPGGGPVAVPGTGETLSAQP